MSMIESLLKTMPEDGAEAVDCGTDGEGDGAGVTAGGVHATSRVATTRSVDCLNLIIRNLRL